MHAVLADAANLALSIKSMSTDTPVLHRLRKRREFIAASKAAKAVTNSIILQGRARKDDSDSIGVGFTASKKVGNAVARNRAKRRMRALARVYVLKNGHPGHDYVLIARKNATTELPYEKLQNDLIKGLERLHTARIR